MKKLKVFNLPWHISNQYELCKLPFEFHFLLNHTRKWDTAIRPFPENVKKWVPYFDEKEEYDLAILHVDQQCLMKVPLLGKSVLFKEVFDCIKEKVPIIIINHGTPVYPEVFMQIASEKLGKSATEAEGEEYAREEMKKLLNGASAIVVNSNEAKKLWGFGEVIIHGLDKEEWFDLRKEPRVATFISPAGLGNKYYGRSLFTETRSILKDKYGIESLWMGSEGLNFRSFDDYRTFIGKTLVYFNPTLGSPMPRTRTEAMFSGCCIVTTRHHDADSFIKDGVNGFICKDNPEHAAKIISNLIFDYLTAVKIGQAGKQTAQELFSGDRFRADWINLIERVLNKKIV